MKNFFSLLSLTVFLVACGDASVESSRPPKGNPDARVLLEEYADLQCPACRNAHGDVSAILAQFGDKIRFEFNHFPLRAIHPYAQDAAEMSECVAQQGKFWEFIDIAFENQSELNGDILGDWAEQAGADKAIAEKCLSSHSTRSAVIDSYKEGRDRGVNSTPTFFVNGEKVSYKDLLPTILKEVEESTMPL